MWKVFVASCFWHGENLSIVQNEMKQHYDLKTVVRAFSPGEQVLALQLLKEDIKHSFVMSTCSNLIFHHLCREGGSAETSRACCGARHTRHLLDGSEDGVCGPDDAVLHAWLDNSEKLAD